VSGFGRGMGLPEIVRGSMAKKSWEMTGKGGMRDSIKRMAQTNSLFVMVVG
jgi:hypothetical protein